MREGGGEEGERERERAGEVRLHYSRHVIIAESQQALKVSFNLPRPRSQPARPPGVCVGCLCFFTAVRTVVINDFFQGLTQRH